MKKTLLFLFGLNIVIFYQLNAQAITGTDSMSVPRLNHQSQKLNNGSVLTFGGENGNSQDPNNTYSSAEIYNNGVWTLTGSMNIQRTQFASSLLPNGKVLAIGGVASDVTEVWASCEIYDPATGLWTYTDSLANASADNYAILMNNGKVLMADGDSSWVYDPSTGRWGSGVAMAAGHGANPVMVSLANGKVLAVGGMDCAVCADVYNPNTNTWALTADSTQYSHIQPAMVLLNNGKALVIGSSTIDSGQTASELYDTVTNSFTNSGTLLSNISSCPAVLLDNGAPLVWGIGNLFGGADSTEIVQIYNVAIGTWFTIPSTGFGTSNNTLVKLSNNVVLVVGGYVLANGAVKYCWLINGDDLTGIKQISQPESFAISPNPGTSYFSFSVAQPENVKVLRIYDVEGRMQQEVSQDWASPVYANALASGTYIVVLYGKDDMPVGVQKWVKL